jgi:hypothetical protein
MAELDGITENLRRMRRDIDAQLESTASSQAVTSELVEKIAELRRRSENVTPGERAKK